MCVCMPTRNFTRLEMEHRETMAKQNSWRQTSDEYQDHRTRGCWSRRGRCPHEWNLSSSHRTAAIGFPFWHLRSRRLTAQLHELMIGGLCTGWHFCLFFMLRLRRFTDKQKKPLLYNDWSACVSVCSCVNVRTSTFLQCALILHCNHRLLVYQCAAYSLLLYYYYTHKIKYHRYDKIYITN